MWRSSTVWWVFTAFLKKVFLCHELRFSLCRTVCSRALPPLLWAASCYVTYVCNVSSKKMDYPYTPWVFFFFLARNHTMWIWVALCNSQGNSVLLTTSLTSTSELPQTDVWHSTTVWPLFTEWTELFQTFKQSWCSTANLKRISFHFLLVNCQGNCFCRIG